MWLAAAFALCARVAKVSLSHEYKSLGTCLVVLRIDHS